MSAMSELATELELKWIEIDGGYEHCSGEYIIHWSQANRVRLFYVHDHLMYWILNGELHTAVARVMASTAAEIAADLVANNPALLADALENTRRLNNSQ